MFTKIYEVLIGRNQDSIYADEIFAPVGLFTLIFAFIFSIIFYIGLGRWKPVFYRISHWVIFFGAATALSIFFALSQAKGAVQSDNYDAYMIRFSLVNALYAVLCFFLLSIALKKASIFAKHTPF